MDRLGEGQPEPLCDLSSANKRENAFRPISEHGDERQIA
jgi:hypothetical protein